METIVKKLKTIHKSIAISIDAIDFCVLQGRLSQQGKLLLQDTFDISYESKKDKRALKEHISRLKAPQRQVFLYENVVLFCKRRDDDTRIKRSGSAAYIYKSALEVRQSVRA